MASSQASKPANGIEMAGGPPHRVGGPRLKVGCCAYSYRQYLTGERPTITLGGFLNRCAEMNLDSVELTAYYFQQPITAASVHQVARRCFLLGLEVAGTAVGNRFTFPPGDERKTQIDMVKQWIDYAVDMGARCIRVFAGAIPQGITEETAQQWVIDCVEECLEYSEPRGILVALENHGGVVATADQTLKLLQRIKSPWFGLKLDSGNFPAADPYAELAKVAQYAITTHIKTDMVINGMKQPADLSRIVEVLREANYRGHLLLEYEGEEEPAVAVPKTLGELQRLSKI
ncbi:MAG: sugar phosphate isomerase/epimerase [Armatimonadetes bacterium]|nr:sugar phosphate isomerase/epimerase [Armatimonadota bacterium]